MGAREEGTGGGSLTRPQQGTWSYKGKRFTYEQLMARFVRQELTRFRENAEAYANLRVQKRTSAVPKQIISNVGFSDRTDPFIWSWLPPAPGAYKTTPSGKTRDWSYIFIHSFGYAIDLAAFRANPRRLAPPGDEYGHNPLRVMAAVRQLCVTQDMNRPRGGKASIHAIITRRGDIIMSVDLNDKAYHGGGQKFKGGPGWFYTSKPYQDNSGWSVGIELEPAMARPAPGRAAELVNYTDRQMLSLAIFCKKLMTINPNIKFNVLSRFHGGWQWNQSTKTWASVAPGSITNQGNALGSGFVQHIDVHYSKLDARGQFAVAPGQKGSGWDQLFGLITRVRDFNLSTEVYSKGLPDLSKTSAAELTSLLTQSDGGQRAVLQTQWDSERAFSRASSMQAQQRREHYKAALGQNAASHDVINKSASTIGKMITRFQGAVKAISGEIQQYNFKNGLWTDGKPQ